MGNQISKVLLSRGSMDNIIINPILKEKRISGIVMRRFKKKENSK